MKKSGKLIKRIGLLPSGYPKFLSDLKVRIRSAQLKAAVSVTRELVLLYWDLGRRIVEKQREEGWGQSVIETLSRDLQKAFPGVDGYSTRNIWRMRAFYLAYSRSLQKLPQPVAELKGYHPPKVVSEIPWGHNILLLEKVMDLRVRLWYAQCTVKYGWSRSVLWQHVETHLFERQGKRIETTNFRRTLPPAQSDLALEIMKDPYNFDFLTLKAPAREKHLEEGLLQHIRRFLLELGVGFSFVGSQFPLSVGGQDFHIDLLFYHLRLRCFVVIELKMGEFKPEYAGKMNFYLSAIDARLRHRSDHPSIGLILCQKKNKLIVEYALRDTRKPIGVSAYRMTGALPKHLQRNLPTAEDIEAELKV
ncbi:MAG: PDDEXK nuclease domain-containing protein [Elusimicrobia bacterium]|nr:PDDEXK nuclease domain-containing protein [Candidatus Obscuribacterium magneticum]